MTDLWAVRIARIKKLGNAAKTATAEVASPASQDEAAVLKTPCSSCAIGTDSDAAEVLIRVLLVRCYGELELPVTRGFFEMLLGEMAAAYWEDRNPLVEDDCVVDYDTDYSASFQGRVTNVDVVMRCGANEPAKNFDAEACLTDEMGGASDDTKATNTYTLQCVYDICLDTVGSELFCRVVGRAVGDTGATIMKSRSYDTLRDDEWDNDVAHRIDYSTTPIIECPRERIAGDGETVAQFFIPNVISTRRRDAVKEDVAQRLGCDANDKAVLWSRVIEEFAKSRVSETDAVLLYTWHLCDSTQWEEREKICAGHSTAYVSILSLNPNYCRAYVLRDALNLELEGIFDEMEKAFPEEESSDVPVPRSWTAERRSQMESVMTRLLHLEVTGKKEQEREGMHVALRLRDAKCAASLAAAWKESGIFVKEESPEFHEWRVDCVADVEAVKRAFDALHRAWGGLF